MGAVRAKWRTADIELGTSGMWSSRLTTFARRLMDHVPVHLCVRQQTEILLFRVSLGSKRRITIKQNKTYHVMAESIDPLSIIPIHRLERAPLEREHVIRVQPPLLQAMLQIRDHEQPEAHDHPRSHAHQGKVRRAVIEDTTTLRVASAFSFNKCPSHIRP